MWLPSIAIVILLAAAPLFGHAISLSNGEATLRGEHLDFVLTMPMYEAAHTPNPDQAFLDHFRFSSRGQAARMTQKSCHADSAKSVYLCAAEYVFAAPVDRLDVECTLFQVTVPNHVHLLKAEYAGKRDQAVFDYSFTQATLRFRPPTMFETAVQQGFEGMMRAVGGPLQLLFLAALVLAARNRRELLLLGGMFLAGEIAATLLAGVYGWQLPVRFVEAAMALSIAYLAVEILFRPEAGGRALIAGVLGGFHGLSLYLVLAGTGFRPAYVLEGAALGEIAILGAFGAAFWMLRQRWVLTRAIQSAAGLLLVFGMAWFFLRMKNRYPSHTLFDLAGGPILWSTPMSSIRPYSGLVLVSVFAGMATAAAFVVLRTLSTPAVQAAQSTTPNVPLGRYSKPSAFGTLITSTSSASPDVKLGAAQVAQIAGKSLVTVIGYDAAENPIAQGPGYVYASSGLIITSYGAIRGASSVVVETAAGQELNVIALMGYNIGRDLAALAVLEGNLPALETGPGEIIQEGETVYAVGTALTIGPRRAVAGTDLIQTNAMVNSGTPVLNEHGRVIGIARRDATILPSHYIPDLLAERRVLSFEQLRQEVQNSQNSLPMVPQSHP
jgi:hypothetical protein